MADQRPIRKIGLGERLGNFVLKFVDAKAAVAHRLESLRLIHWRDVTIGQHLANLSVRIHLFLLERVVLFLEPLFLPFAS